jgi:hypothetical protein
MPQLVAVEARAALVEREQLLLAPLRKVVAPVVLENHRALVAFLLFMLVVVVVA